MNPTRSESDLERLMDDFFDRRARAWWPERWSLPAVLDIEPPVVDFYKEKDDLVVKAELPGMEKEDIEVNVTDHTLTIKGEKKKEEDGRRRKVLPIGTLFWVIPQKTWSCLARFKARR